MDETPSLRNLLCDHVSSSTLKMIDGELRVVGKYGQITLMDGFFDIWIVGPDLTPVSTRRINLTAEIFRQEGSFIKLTGEAYVRTKDKALILKSLRLLGIKAKRRLSAKTTERLKKQMAEIRPTSNA